MTSTTYGSAVVAACEQAWQAVQERHEGVPDVVIILGDGKGQIRGHFHPKSWHSSQKVTMHEVLIAGQRLADGPDGVLSTLIHEAVHAYCQEHDIKETSRQGRYHNKRFAAVARDFGLDVTEAAGIGHSNTSLSEGTAEAYTEAHTALKEAIDLYKRTPMTLAQIFGPEGEDEKPKTSSKAICECVPERELTISKKKLEEGPIICGLCEAHFQHPEV